MCLLGLKLRASSGSWACVYVLDGVLHRVQSGYCHRGSDFSMELPAIIKAIEGADTDSITVHTDIRMVVELHKERRLHTRLTRKKHRRLWKLLIKAMGQCDVEFVHVKSGNSDTKWYNLAHVLARCAAEEQPFDSLNRYGA